MVDPVNSSLSLGSSLAELRASAGTARLMAPEEGSEFEVDGVQFVCDYQFSSTADHFYIVKRAPHARAFAELCRRYKGGRFVELGIAEGGSAALAALEGQPSKMVCIDIEPGPVVALADFIAARGLGDSVVQFGGVDQSDRSRLRSIFASEFGGEQIDFVVDDASHDLSLTRQSFDIIFPLVRPGGRYVIEDWNGEQIWRHGIAESLRAMPPEQLAAELSRAAAEPAAETAPRPRPLSDLAVELLLVAALPIDVIRSIEVTNFHVVVERGADPIDADTFRLLDVCQDYVGYLPG